MSLYAQIVQGRVHGIFEYDPLPVFPSYIVMIELPIDSPVEPGWLYEDDTFMAPIDLDSSTVTL